jgi:hypothetical protein
MSTDTLGFIIGKGNALEHADKSVHCTVKNQASGLIMVKQLKKTTVAHAISMKICSHTVKNRQVFRVKRFRYRQTASRRLHRIFG